MRITAIDCHVLVQPAYDTTAASSAQDDIVVEIHTDEGITGIGETDVNPWIARACHRGARHPQHGPRSDARCSSARIRSMWRHLGAAVRRSAMNGRRGAVINAIGALDIALHDLRGKALGKPCYELLGGAVRDHVVPYASLQPETVVVRGIPGLDGRLGQAGGGGRVPSGQGRGDARGALRAHRPAGAVGAQHRGAGGRARTRSARRRAVWSTCSTPSRTPTPRCTCLPTGSRSTSLFVETPLWPDDLDGYRRLADEQPIPIAAGEWLTTRFEHLDLMDRGHVQVVQPDIGRVGGLTEARRVCDLAADRGFGSFRTCGRPGSRSPRPPTGGRDRALPVHRVHAL